MKRAFCIMAAMLLVVLSGCAKQQKAVTVPVTEGLNCKFNATYNGVELEGTLKISENMHTEINVQKPDLLKGMTIRIKDSVMTVDYLGLSSEIPMARSSEGAFASLMVSALKSAAAAVGVTTTQTDNGYCLSGRCDMGDYFITLDKSLRPVQLKMESQDFLVCFSNFFG